MRKILPLIICCVLMFCAGCGDRRKESTEAQTGNPVSAETHLDSKANATDESIQSDNTVESRNEEKLNSESSFHSPNSHLEITPRTIDKTDSTNSKDAALPVIGGEEANDEKNIEAVNVEHREKEQVLSAAASSEDSNADAEFWEMLGIAIAEDAKGEVHYENEVLTEEDYERLGIENPGSQNENAALNHETVVEEETASSEAAFDWETSEAEEQVEAEGVEYIG